MRILGIHINSEKTYLEEIQASVTLGMKLGYEKGRADLGACILLGEVCKPIIDQQLEGILRNMGVEVDGFWDCYMEGK